jgi:plastocyanin
MTFPLPGVYSKHMDIRYSCKKHKGGSGMKFHSRLFLFISLVTLVVMGGCATPSPAPTPTPTPTPPPTSTTTLAPGQSVTIDLIAKNIAFDKSTITVAAGAQVTVNFDNQDSGVAHNFAVYTDASTTTQIFVGQIITGPKTITYTFTAPPTPGNYFFRCDVHPTTMTGTLVVIAS